MPGTFRGPEPLQSSTNCRDSTCIEAAMAKVLYLVIFLGGSLVAAQPPDNHGDGPPAPTGIEWLSTDHELRGKTTLVRGVLERLDPIHDQLLVRPFGGKHVRIAFDTRTELVHGNTRTSVTNIPAGSIVSVDTVMDNGRMFARTVRLPSMAAGDLYGQVVRYDAAKSEILLRDPGSPDNVALRVTAKTVVVNRDQPSSVQALAPGMLVQVKFVPAQNDATHIQILAERGNAFTFAGRVVSVDLRTRLVALSNDSDQTVRELSIASLDPTSLRLLREGADVNIQADFDGDRYNARTVTLVPHNQ